MALLESQRRRVKQRNVSMEQNGKYIILDEASNEEESTPIKKEMEVDPMDEIRRRRMATEKLMSVRNAHCDMMLHKKQMTIDKQETKSVRLLQNSVSQVHYEFKVMQVSLQKNEIEKRRLQDPNADFTFEIAHISKNEQLLKGGANDVFYMQKHNPTQTRSMKNPKIVSPALAEARKILRQKATERELETYRQRQLQIEDKKKRPHTTGNRDIKFIFDEPYSKHHSTKLNSVENKKTPRIDRGTSNISESTMSIEFTASPVPKTPRNVTPHKSVRIQPDLPQGGSTGDHHHEQNEHNPQQAARNHSVTSGPLQSVNKNQINATQQNYRIPIKSLLVNLPSTEKSDMGLYSKMLLKKEGKLQVEKGSDAILKLREMGLIPPTREKSSPNLTSAKQSHANSIRSTPTTMSRSHTTLSVTNLHSPNHLSMPGTPRRPRTQGLIHNEQVLIQQKLHKFYHAIEEDKQRWLQEQEMKKEAEEVEAPVVPSGLELLLQQAAKESKVDKVLLGLPPLSKNLPAEEYRKRRSEQLRKKWREVGQKVIDNLDSGMFDDPEEEIPTTGHVYAITPMGSHTNSSASNNKSQTGAVFAPDGTVIQRFTGFGNATSKRGGPPMHSSNRSKRKTATFKLRKLVEDIMANKTRYELQEYADTRKKMSE